MSKYPRKYAVTVFYPDHQHRYVVWSKMTAPQLQKTINKSLPHDSSAIAEYPCKWQYADKMRQIHIEYNYREELSVFNPNHRPTMEDLRAKFVDCMIAYLYSR